MLDFVMPTLALSIRQPWAHHIIFNGKDVENRTWLTRFRGPVLIHAGKKPEDAAYCRAFRLPLGGIVGVMEIVDCVTAMDSEWFEGPFGFVLAHARPLEFVPCQGALGFFRPAIEPVTLRLKEATDA
jgi:hypothetical protein